MSQNDFTIANQSFPAFRADLNSALQALASNNSGGSAPSTTFANMWWYDSSNNILYIRNEDNDAWIQFATLDQANDLFVVTSSIDVGDNVKALFGDGDDLQIYHDGSNSYVQDAGDGRLNLRSDGAGIDLQTSTGATMIRANKDADVRIYYNNSQKLATTNTGIDVTGTVVSDGLNVLAGNGVIGTAQINRDNDGLGGISSIALTLANDGTSAGTGVSLRLSPADVQTSGRGSLLSSTLEGTNGSNIELWTVVNGQFPHKSMEIDGNGDISFYEDTGSTAKLFWDSSAEELRIGTTSSLTTSGKLTVQGSSSDDQYLSYIKNTNTSLGQGLIVRVDHSNNRPILNANANGTTVFTAKANGNVGIGTSSPDRLLHIYEGNSGITPNSSAHLTLESDGVNFFNILKPNGTAGGIAFSGNSTNGDGSIIYDDSSALRAMQFYTASTEAMRIDSSQNLLVGLTSESLWQTEAGCTIRPTGAATFTRDSNPPVLVNLLGSDTNLISFYKNNSIVGSIGTESTDIYIGTTDTGIRFNDAVNGVLPYNTSTGQTDATLDLGFSTVRWRNLYLSGGVVLDDNPTAVGGDVTSKTLDDYEEGTWTPAYSPQSGSFGSVTYAAATAGNYTKIGNTVYFTFYIQTNAITVGSATGTVTIEGLPFTANGGTTSNGGGSVINAAFFAGDKPSYGTASTSKINLFYTTGSTADDIQLNVSDLATGSTANVFQMMGTYLTTA